MRILSGYCKTIKSTYQKGSRNRKGAVRVLHGHHEVIRSGYYMLQRF